MKTKALLVAGLLAFGVGAVALPATAHCKCTCKTTKTVAHKTTKPKAKVVKAKTAKAKPARTKTIIKTVVVEKPVIVERVVYRDPPPPPPPSPVVYVGGVWCKKTVKVTYSSQSHSSQSRHHYEGWRADHGHYGSRQVAYNGGW